MSFPLLLQMLSCIKKCYRCSLTHNKTISLIQACIFRLCKHLILGAQDRLYLNILCESQHHSACAYHLQKGSKFLIIILETRVATCGTCKSTRSHENTRVYCSSCSWFIPYQNCVTCPCISLHSLETTPIAVSRS